MIFYSSQTLICLLLASLPAIVGSYMFFIRKKFGVGLTLLLFSAILLRLLIITLDPFLHDWDERFHALVAKNLISHPFKPMLFPKHIMLFNPLDWAYGHIWVHKQPLFLWQMAISMKIFGINTIAIRLPSAILGVIMVWFVYDLAKRWLRNINIAYLAALLSAFSYYTLELTSGWLSLEHNDLVFTFYVTGSFWAFSNYLDSSSKTKWAIIIGVFAGMAILNKWLVGLLIFGGWGLYIIYTTNRFKPRAYLDITISILVACLIFIPWQIYIINNFPAESAIAYEYNKKHLTEDLGHPGSVLFHIRFLTTSYNLILLPFLLIGIIGIFTSKTISKVKSISFIAIIVVVFGFFSIFVATKMPAFVYCVSSLLFCLIAFGIYLTFVKLYNYLNIQQKHRREIWFLISILVLYSSLKPNLIIDQRSPLNVIRNNKIHNTTIYRNLDESNIENRVILNCRAYENIELMFYKNMLAYHWYPEENVLDSLQKKGYTFAVFDYTNDQQSLPEYIKKDTNIIILHDKLK